MQFPLFERLLDKSITNEELAAKNASYFKTCVALAVGRLFIDFDTSRFAVNMYLAKLYKHRPGIAKAMEDDLLYSPKEVVGEIKYYTRRFVFNRQTQVFRKNTNAITALIKKASTDSSLDIEKELKALNEVL